MFFFLDIPKWVIALVAAALAAILGIVFWVLRSNMSASAGAVEYMSEYEAGSGKSSSSAKRDERTVAPPSGFELQPGQQPHNTVIPKGGGSGRRSVPSQTGAPPASEGGRGRGGRN